MTATRISRRVNASRPKVYHARLDPRAAGPAALPGAAPNDGMARDYGV